MTELRKKNGRAKPWGVKYWGLGNEMDGPWQMGHRSAEDYGKFSLEAAKLMKWTDPERKAGCGGQLEFQRGLDWLEQDGAGTSSSTMRIIFHCIRT